MIGPVDSHAHLDEVPAIDDALVEARQAGVAAVVGVGMDLDSNRRILELAEAYPGFVRPALGAHPWNIDDSWPENLAFLAERLDGAVALGEVGLDYKVKVKKELQIEVFGRVLEQAARFNKPVSVHSRFSQERCLRMLIEAGIEKAVFHWYSGPLEIMDQILAQGYFISATPALAYSPPHRAALQRAPLDRILVETDSPVKYQGLASRPVHVLRTVVLLAELRGATREEIAARTLKNATNFFDLRWDGVAQASSL